MAENITQSQQNNLSFLESTGGEYKKLDLSGIDKTLVKYANIFKNNLLANIKKHKISASGQMEKNVTFDIVDEDGVKTLNIYVVNYAKYVDKGVKGWFSSKNAPNSPYSYSRPDKTNSNGAFQSSIKNLIQSGKAKVKVSDIKRYGAVGYENKNVKHKGSLIDEQTRTMVYLIKKYGIKRTNFLSETIDSSFKNLSVDISTAVGREIAIQIRK